MTAREAGTPTRLVRSNALFCGTCEEVEFIEPPLHELARRLVESIHLAKAFERFTHE